MAIMLKSPLVIETDEDFVRVARENAGYHFERDEDGTIIVSPTFSNGGIKSGEAYGQLRDFAKRMGGKAADSNTGFAIGPGARIFCPDAAWISDERIASLSEKDRAKFWPLSPDVVIEVRSESDTFAETVVKLDLFIGRGTTYAVAIDPFTRESVTRGNPPPGLEIDIDAIIDA